MSDRDQRGRWLRGNSGAVKSGAYRAGLRAGGIPSELLLEMTAFREAVSADRGGLEQMTEIERGYTRRLVELETFCRLLVGDIQARGIVTKAGRVRNSYTLFLSTCDRWDRIAGKLGMDRREKRLNVAERLAQFHEDQPA